MEKGVNLFILSKKVEVGYKDGARMFRTPNSIVSTVSNLVAKGRQAMHHVSEGPFHPAKNIHVLHVTIMEEKSIIDNHSKSCIFFKDDVLLLSRKHASTG